MITRYSWRKTLQEAMSSRALCSKAAHSEGETVEDALANIKEAIELCIEDLEANGDDIPEASQTVVGSVVIVHYT